MVGTKKKPQRLLRLSTRGGNRTRTTCKGHRILSPACLPVPPPEPIKKNSLFRELFFRAKDEVRTRDPDLGKVVLYQLSYFRLVSLFVDCKYRVFDTAVKKKNEKN